jgi:hypothetical protein
MNCKTSKRFADFSCKEIQVERHRYFAVDLEFYAKGRLREMPLALRILEFLPSDAAADTIRKTGLEPLFPSI